MPRTTGPEVSAPQEVPLAGESQAPFRTSTISPTALVAKGRKRSIRLRSKKPSLSTSESMAVAKALFTLSDVGNGGVREVEASHHGEIGDEVGIADLEAGEAQGSRWDDGRSSHNSGPGTRVANFEVILENSGFKADRQCRCCQRCTNDCRHEDATHSIGRPHNIPPSSGLSVRYVREI